MSYTKIKMISVFTIAISMSHMTVQAEPVQKQKTSYRDAATYCRNFVNADIPGRPYIGPRLPSSVRRTFDGSADNWRCMDGKIWACFGGASGAACDKMNPSRIASRDITDFCQANPNQDFVPMSVIGNSSSTWRCNGRRAVIIETFPLDKRNYMIGSWRLAS